MQISKTQNIKRNPKFIKISNVRASDNKLEVMLEFSKDVGKYFFKNHFEVYYDKNIENVDESILTIPAVCVTIQVAWATGADLYVDKLDEDFLLSLPNIRKEFQKFYPKFSSSGDIHVEKIITNKFNNTQNALLFSGGLDSIVSYITHKDKHPVLITLLSLGNSSNIKYQNKIRNYYKKFAEQEGIWIHFIESKIIEEVSDTLNNYLLAREFNVYNWWGGVSHGLILLGLCAPLTMEKIGTVIIASSYAKQLRKPQGSHLFAYTDISWSDVKVLYDASDYSRQLKIRHIFKENPEYHKFMRCCLFSLEEGQKVLRNCGNCEKCLRTITGLIMEGIDPNECNFEIKKNVLDYIKKLFITGSFQTHVDIWKRMEDVIPESIKNDKVSQKYHAKQFFEWFRGFDFENYNPPNFFGKLKYLYYSIKYNGIDYSKREIRLYFSRRIIKK